SCEGSRPSSRWLLSSVAFRARETAFRPAFRDLLPLLLFALLDALLLVGIATPSAVYSALVPHRPELNRRPKCHALVSDVEPISLMLCGEGGCEAFRTHPRSRGTPSEGCPRPDSVA